MQAVIETDILFGPETVGDFVSGLDQNEKIYVGSGSGYFFIGDAGLFLQDMPAIDRAFRDANAKKMNRCRTVPKSAGVPLRDRKVRKYYRKLLGNGSAVIVEGKEVGGFWTEDEFRQAMKEAGNDYAQAVHRRNMA